ncbi:uncharacterized protein DUF3224 [Undibacterium pigrum]|uniref:Uncharacterized protein DUF3224 n=2 Tax=Undibacterium pigrum TaxID=401470 RepID=A0A318IN50_9BURK|nr:uncharacterized protein DUF3224 [Undibacterium pigrum]
MKIFLSRAMGMLMAGTFCLYTDLSVALSPVTIVKEQHMEHMQNTHKASGKFEVKLSPQAAAPGIEAARLGRMTIDKQFYGDLQAHSLGEMMSAMGEIKGSAGYVAIERVSGTLLGKKGSFVLMHTGTMNRGQPQLTIQVVPDSGTDELTGISGTMGIDIREGQHFYNFDFNLP